MEQETISLSDHRPLPKGGSIVVLTGAGISRESGLSTFRDADGIWAQVRVEDVATPEAFARDPARVQAFYNARRGHLLDAAVRPNAAHLALARLEAAWPGEILLVTQNIDDLHERAGSRHLVHMHGELLRARCTSCQASSPWRAEIGPDSLCPACAGGNSLRPDVVWFGETPYHLDRIYGALAACDLFLSIGTSGSVYPAAGFVAEVRASGGGHTVELNLEPSEGASLFAEVHHGPAASLVPAYVERLLSERSLGS